MRKYSKSPPPGLKSEIMQYALDHTGEDAAIKYGYDRSTITRWLRAAGKGKGKSKYTDEWWEEVKQYMGVLPDADIAIKFGCAKSTIGNKRRGFGIESAIKAKQVSQGYRDPDLAAEFHRECQSALNAWTRPKGCTELLEEICALSMES